MRDELKIGQSFEVFEINNLYRRNDLPQGFQSVGTRSPLMPNVLHVEILGKSGAKFTIWGNEFKKVGTLVITKVKSQEEMAAFQKGIRYD